MDSNERRVYLFGDFVLEGAKRRLSRRESSEPITLTAKTFDTLLYLVEHREEVLSKDRLLNAVWPGVVVEENSLTQSVSALRQVLGETPGTNRYVATIPRQGYRFVAEVTEADAPAAGSPTPQRIERRAPESTPPRGRWIGTAVVACIAAIVGIGFAFWRSAREQPAPAVQTVAVLPFKPLLPAQRNESLELAMTESIIGSLGAREGVVVSPLSSVRRYAGIEEDPLAAGRALHADAVLDGSLQYQGDRLRVSVRLLRVADGRQLWSNQYDETLNGIFGVQAEISSKVALALPRHDANPQPGAVGGTRDAAAYLLYASGRYALTQSTEPSLVLALGYFEQAIARDPNFALAHAGLGDCYSVMGIFGMRSPGETFPRARDAVLKALQIEPRLANAFGVLGHIKMQYDRDWDGAEADLKQAIALNPALSEPHMYLGVVFAMRGETERGLEELRQAQQLEPLLTLPKTRAGSILYFARRYDESLVLLNESLALDDRPGVLHAALGRVYMHTGRYDLALAEFAKIQGPTPGSFGDVGQALALSGRRAEALAELDRVLKLSRQRYVSALDVASIYAALGDSENALTWLERALRERAAALGFLAQNPAFDALHRDPRFVAIVERIGVWKRPLTR